MRRIRCGIAIWTSRGLSGASPWADIVSHAVEARILISPHVHLVRGAIGTGFVAIYIVVGRRVALVDTGFAYHPGRAIEPALASLGLSLRDIDLVLTTHGHPDHVGGHAAVAAVSAARLAVHAADRDRLAGRTAEVLATDEFLVDFRRLGLARRASEREALLIEVGGSGIRALRQLNDGERIDLGGSVTMDLVHTPGHTRGSMSFVVQPDQTVLVGDAIQGLGGGSGLPLYQDPEEYRSSLARLGQIGASIVGLGHPFRSALLDRSSPVVSGKAIGSILGESATFPIIADETARGVVASWPPSGADAVRAFLRRLPPPFEHHDPSLERVGGASLHAALLHLDRATRSAV